MVINKEIEITANNYVIKYYRDKGYILETNQKFLVKIEDLIETSKCLVNVKCDVCDKERLLMYYLHEKSIKNGGLYTCSNKCSSEKRKNTNLEKFGTDHASQSLMVKDKMKSTNIERYGVEYYSQTIESKDKKKSTNIERYGVEHYSKTDEFKEKYKKTVLDKYGVDNTFKSDVIKEKIKETTLNKYGVVHISQSEEIKDKRKKTNIERYGIEFAQSSAYVKDKIKNSNYKYNAEKFKEEYLNNDTYNFIESNNNNLKLLHVECGEIFDITHQNHNNRKGLKITLCTKCYPISDTKSIKEKELVNWLKELNVDFLDGDKNVLNGKELDIYIPKSKLAIEMNGLYWHSELYKENNYHLNKTLECEKQNIQLLHIWEDEWVFKQNIVKSIILNKLNKIENKIYARQCKINIVEDLNLIREFLDNNHIQGYNHSSIKLGLYHQNELVSLMTFGRRMINKKVEFELLRFCNKINLNIIGASSKLFKYFLKNYNFNEIVSYSDYRLFNGNMYDVLGFTKVHLSKPEYYWCNRKLERFHRSKFMKHKLVEEGYDINKTEEEIMYERCYFRLFGCGQYRWIYKNV